MPKKISKRIRELITALAQEYVILKEDAKRIEVAEGARLTRGFNHVQDGLEDGYWIAASIFVSDDEIKMRTQIQEQTFGK